MKAPRHGPIIVAELGASHQGSLTKALELVHAAKEAGASTVKVQCWDTMTVDTRKIEAGPWKGESLTGLYQRCKLPWDYIGQVAAEADALGIGWFSSAFDRASVDFLETLGCPMYKISSFEITDLALIRYARAKKKAVILSTGMASYEETAKAVTVASDGVGAPPMVLACTSAYPAPDKPSANGKLAAILAILRDEGLPPWIGLSDHTRGSNAAVNSLVAGSVMIEKHLKLENDTTSPDAGFASTPKEFLEMAAAVRTMAENSILAFSVQREEEESSRFFRRSIWVTRHVPKGHVIAGSDIAVLRPIGGLPPDQFAYCVGRIAAQDLHPGTPLVEACLA